MVQKNIMISGGHSGIGLELTKMLYAKGHKLGLIVRNKSRIEHLSKHIDISQVDFFFADLSIQSEVVRVTEDIKSSWERIDVLYNNAGIAIMKGERRHSKQANELHFEINTLAPYILTNLLKPLLLNADEAKVVTTVTQGLNRLDLKLKDVFDVSYSSGMKLYSQSKLAVMVLMNDLSGQESWNGVSFYCVHPGNNKTNMTQSKENMPAFIKLMVSLFFKSPQFGGQRLYNAAFMEQFKGKSGLYLYNDKVVALKRSLAKDEKDTILSAIKGAKLNT